MSELIASNAETISLCFGIVAVILGFTCFQCKKHAVLMLIMTVSCILWCCHFGFKGLWTPVCMNLISAIRSFVYSQRTKKSWANRGCIPWIFVIISVLATIFTWSDLWGILTMVATMIQTYATWQTDTKKVKVLTIPVSSCWLVYNAVHNSIPGVVNETFVLLSIAIYFLRTHHKE